MPVILVCQYEPCGKEFPVKHCHYGAKFCSTACRSLSQHDRVMVLCEECGLPFSVKKSRILRQGTTKVTYCSNACKHLGRSRRVLESFWSNVHICEHGSNCPYCCHEWTGLRDNGYGLTRLDKKTIGTHRLVWILVNNRPFPDDLFACHYCHNRACTNIWHIHPGTQQENIDDSTRDGRHAFGERHYEAHLTEDAVRQALHLYEAGWSIHAIARQNHVSHAVMSHVVHRRNWKHVNK